MICDWPPVKRRKTKVATAAMLRRNHSRGVKRLGSPRSGWATAWRALLGESSSRDLIADLARRKIARDRLRIRLR